MSSALLPVKLWGVLEPNVQKIEMVLRELGLEFERVPVSYLEVKTPEYLAVNPNGRLPSLQDPNNGILLWETGAIIEYLVETYDKNQSISFAPGSNNAFLAKQWLFFQTSGQGPCRLSFVVVISWRTPTLQVYFYRLQSSYEYFSTHELSPY